MPMIHHVHIAGAGIAGLFMALCLQQQGVAFTLYEQSPDISYNEVGLGLSSNVFPILDKLGLLASTRLLGDDILHFRFADKQLEPVKEFALHAPALSINRKQFHQLLYRHLDKSNLKLNTRFPLSHTVGSNEIIIGADGIHSAIRGRMYSGIPIRSSGQVLWRGIACMPLPEEFKQSYFDIIGGNMRFAIVHIRGNHYSWYAITEGSTDKVIVPSAAARQMLMKLFSHYHPVVNMIIHATDNIYCNYLQDIKPSDRRVPWFQDNTVLMGDAIHPATPNLANGACLAIEDAFVLSRLMQQHIGGSFDSIFSQYQQLREEKVNRIVQQSWYLGKLMHQPNRMLDKAMIMGTRLTPAFLFKKIYAPVLHTGYKSLMSAEVI
ncbi:FAD-dependent monooxygenase [Filimonas lacunae]|nr:FAD-dependent monooxygenase [Filimonas lacunae]